MPASTSRKCSKPPVTASSEMAAQNSLPGAPPERHLQQLVFRAPNIHGHGRSSSLKFGSTHIHSQNWRLGEFSRVRFSNEPAAGSEGTGMGSSPSRWRKTGIRLHNARFLPLAVVVWKVCKSRPLWRTQICEPLVPWGDERTFHTADTLCTGVCDLPVGDVGNWGPQPPVVA